MHRRCLLQLRENLQELLFSKVSQLTEEVQLVRGLFLRRMRQFMRLQGAQLNRKRTKLLHSKSAFMDGLRQ